jgi:hypothetical protein
VIEAHSGSPCFESRESQPAEPTAFVSDLKSESGLLEGSDTTVGSKLLSSLPMVWRFKAAQASSVSATLVVVALSSD